MDFPRGNAAEFTFGAGSTPGPSPDAVAVVAQRLLALAAEWHALLNSLESVSTVDWSSQAATAFRDDLVQCGLQLAAAGRSVEDAAELVHGYGAWLAGQELGALGGWGGASS